MQSPVFQIYWDCHDLQSAGVVPAQVSTLFSFFNVRCFPGGSGSPLWNDMAALNVLANCLNGRGGGWILSWHLSCSKSAQALFKDGAWGTSRQARLSKSTPCSVLRRYIRRMFLNKTNQSNAVLFLPRT